MRKRFFTDRKFPPRPWGIPELRSRLKRHYNKEYSAENKLLKREGTLRETQANCRRQDTEFK